MPHQKLIRVLNYVWLLVVFPVAVAILVGVFGYSASLGFKTFLLIECGMAVLSPLLNAVISDGNHTRITTAKIVFLARVAKAIWLIVGLLLAFVVLLVIGAIQPDQVKLLAGGPKA